MAILETTLEEQARRREAVEHTRSEARLEGLSPDPETEGVFDQYVEGTLTAEELHAQLIAHYQQT